ncbi:MAG: class I adenylate-forming enzyme family protein [Kiritimatiellae bacterium]|nr:class I adenylate-forming enzyme family protein [Kiritimatiellia bacterium]
MTDNIFETLKHASRAHRDRIAVYERDRTTSFAELFDDADALKTDLALRAVGPGKVMGVRARNGAGFIKAMLAVMGTGAAALPVSHQLKPAEVETISRDARLHAILDADPAENEQCPVLKAGSDAFGFRSIGVGTDEQKPGFDISPAFIRFTSGTTGKSKGVALSHASLIARLDAADAALMLKDEDRILWVLPMAYHFLVTILLYLKRGIPIIVCPDMLAQSLLEMGNAHQATVLYASPMHIRLLAADKTDTNFRSLRWAISTSAATPPPVMQAFETRYGVPVTQVYGIIEAGLPLVNTDLSAKGLADVAGRTAPQFESAILDAEGAELPQGEIGHLAIRGRGMFDAYLDPYMRCEAVMVKGWFLTGDLAQVGEDGYTRIKGREKSVINVSGNKAFPEEVEAVLLQHPSVTACRVFGRPHPLTGEVVCAEIVPGGVDAPDTEALLKFCRERLSTFKIPQYVTRVDQIQQTDSGKTARA